MTDKDCEELINLCESNLEKLKVLSKRDDYRIAEGCFVSEKIDVASNYRDRIAKMLYIPQTNMEDVHLVKYEVGGEYKEHQDWFHPSQDYYRKEMERGGQRIKTALVYLNDDFSGGDTTFPKIGMRITPKKGKLVVWDNVTAEGELSYDSTHIGEIVTEGVKYIAVIWMRAQYFWNWDYEKKTWYNTEDRWKNNEWYNDLPTHLKVQSK
jgi:prolyl 4-hydroxylase